MSPGGGSRRSVLLIREWEQQMSSSRCCGRLEGDVLLQQGERCFPERREIMEEMGPLYRRLRRRWGDVVDVHVVDPRNLPTLVGLLWRDVRAGRVCPLEAVRTLFGISVTSVVVDGRLMWRGRWPSIAEVEAALGLGARAAPAGPGPGRARVAP